MYLFMQEDESESEPSEALHMSSLSCVGPDLEIVEAGATETLMQKFTRLHCEVGGMAFFVPVPFVDLLLIF